MTHSMKHLVQWEVVKFTFDHLPRRLRVATLCLLALVLLLPAAAGAGTARPSLPIERCAQHLPFGVPALRRTDTTLICREGYALEHDNRAKLPGWVAYRLTPRNLQLACSKRTGDWDADPSLPRGARAEVRDYSKSGYDIGHMAPNADMAWSEQVEVESNVLSNAAPQLPGLNRAAWLALENSVRSWVLNENRPFLVYVGPIYDRRGATTIGPGRVTVPTAFFKVVLDIEQRQVLSFIYPHVASQEKPATFKTSIAEVQRQTGLVLPLPRGVKEPALLPSAGPTRRGGACQ